MKVLNAGVRLFAAIMFLGLAVNLGGLWWLLFIANLALFVAWAWMAFGTIDKMEERQDEKNSPFPPIRP